MTKLTKEEFLLAAWEKFNTWQKSQEGQTDGYQYEKSFDEMMVSVSKQLLEESATNPKTKQREKKK